MDAQRVRSGEIKSCRCKSQVLQGYYNSVATAADLFAGRFPTPNPVNTAAGAAGNLRGGAYAPDWRNFRIPLRGAQSQSRARRGASFFLRNEYFAIEEKRKWRAKPASPHVMSPDFHCARLMRTQRITGYRKSRHGGIHRVSGLPLLSSDGGVRAARKE